jgi:carbon monoxide dehydrogenase subunit G
MIETEHSVVIDAPIESVWSYVQDIRQWANLFPGCRECTVIDEHDSRWILKVGAGGMVRTVNALVHVDAWDGPQRVNFSFHLEGDPVEGGGSYVASQNESGATDVTLQVRVQGSGSMAPMWEAISKPLLPLLAKSFSGKLKAEIEKNTATAPPLDATTAKPSLLAAIGKKLRHS